MRYPGRHGSMSSGELELLIARNSQFLAVRRSGAGDGVAGLYDGITGEFINGIGGGRIPEWSYMRDTAPRLVRGWRNILYEILHKRKLIPTKEIRKWLGDSVMRDVMDYGLRGSPKFSPEPTKVYVSDGWASGTSGL